MESNNVNVVLQMIEAAEKNLASAKLVLKNMPTGRLGPSVKQVLESKAAGLAGANDGVSKVVEGLFDGQNMIGPDKKVYPVPVNYASKSKLVVGDMLKLIIAEDGSFIYKQIQPVERKKVVGLLVQDDENGFRVVADGKTFKVLYAALTHYKAMPGDSVVLLVPEDGDTLWAAVENVIHNGEENSYGNAAEVEMSIGDVPKPVKEKKSKKDSIDAVLDLDEEF